MAEMQDAAQIARSLEEIASLLTLSALREKDAGGRFKARAFERGAELLHGMAGQLATLVAEDRLKGIEGIGPSLHRQIMELWTDGQSSLLTRLREEHGAGAAELSRVPGMTPRRIAAAQDGLGIHSIEELRAACDAGRLRTLPGFGLKTEQRICKGLHELAAKDIAPKQLRLGEALELSQRIEQHLKQQQAVQAVQLTGSARRGEELVNELELAVVTDDAQQTYDALKQLPIITYVDERNSAAQLTAGVPLRLHHSTSKSADLSLLLSTGPQSHIFALQKRAAERGMSLDQLFKQLSADPNTANEPALYQALGLPYVPPELRSVALDLSVLTPHALDDLIVVSDVRGMVHCHTTYSDGKNSIEEMALAAQALGMDYITITDHSPTANYAGGVTLDALKRQWDEIAAVQERVKIRILRGTESDILGDGNLDYPDSVLEQLDVVIASIHARLRMSREDMTSRLVRAMSLPVFKIWGHALGRLLLSRDPIDCDLPKVFDALASSRGAIELSGDPHRMDLPPAFIPEARARNIPFVVSVDAHSTRGFDALPLGVTMARRGGVPRSEVLNTLPTERFLSSVRPA